MSDYDNHKLPGSHFGQFGDLSMAPKHPADTKPIRWPATNDDLDRKLDQILVNIDGIAAKVVDAWTRLVDGTQQPRAEETSMSDSLKERQQRVDRLADRIRTAIGAAVHEDELLVAEAVGVLEIVKRDIIEDAAGEDEDDE